MPVETLPAKFMVAFSVLGKDYYDVVEIKRQNVNYNRLLPKESVPQRMYQ